ncbi:MAG: ribosomal protein S18-alanine N-acetyltransferase [Lachnospiraceae bacterium]|nr:ribosomal protein S18-alanine N-acetyltransferase [Lachnospiraceae bacterium]
MTLNIRRLKKEDAEELSAVEKEIFGKNAWTKNDFIETTAIDYAYYLVAEAEDKRIIGACGYRDLCGEADITNVCVIPEMRRRGIAEKMLRALMEHGLEQGVRDFTLEVRSENSAAIRLYEKLGFIPEGVRPSFYEDPKDDALIMWKRNIKENNA